MWHERFVRLCAGTIILLTFGCNKAPTDHVNGPIFPVVVDGQWGAIDQAGRMLVHPRFDAVSIAQYGDSHVQRSLCIAQSRMILSNESQWLVVGADGVRRMRPPVEDWDYIINWDDSLFAVYGPGGESVRGFELPIKVIDLANRWKPASGVTLAHGGGDLKVIEKDGKFGYANRNGEVVISPRFTLCSPFVEGRAAVYVGSKTGWHLPPGDPQWGYIDSSGAVVVPLQYTSAGNFDAGMARVGSTDGSHHLFIDRDGQELHIWPHPIVTLLDNLLMKSCGLILEYDSQQFREETNWETIYGYRDAFGNWAIQPRFESAGLFFNDLAWVLSPTESGFINKSGELTIRVPKDAGSPKTINDFHYGLAWIEAHNKSGYINMKGEWVWTTEDDL